jgi:TM2 domain-containing membrane protein YozV
MNFLIGCIMIVLMIGFMIWTKISFDQLNKGYDKILKDSDRILADYYKMLK